MIKPRNPICSVLLCSLLAAISVFALMGLGRSLPISRPHNAPIIQTEGGNRR
jgi:hypothetical protein